MSTATFVRFLGTRERLREGGGGATRACRLLAVGVIACCLGACEDPAPKSADASKPDTGKSVPIVETSAPKPALVRTEPPPRELLEPVDLWRNGQPAGQVDAQGSDAGEYVFMDLGEAWTPVLFSDPPELTVDDAGVVDPQQKKLVHSFRPTYLALARGEFPNDPYGERARDDKYLELYGIMPTLAVLQKRLTWARNLECSKHLDLTAINNFNGVVSYEGPEQALVTRTRYLVARNRVEKLLAEQDITDPAALLTLEQVQDKDKSQVKYYLKYHDDFEAIKAAQDRLFCEGYFKGKGKWTKGAFDWPTHEALAEFERRHRVYSWGAMGRDTLEALRMDTSLVEHETVIRVLTERAIHAFGAIEDGSAKKADGSPITYKGADGQMHAVPNLESELRSAVIEGFGLKDPAGTAAFLEKLGELESDGHRYVAIPGPRRPEYHSPDMEIRVSIDRGDVWYEFPFDEQGKEKPQPVSRRPRTTILVKYLDQVFPIASFGTTIGGWRSELIDNNVWWKYKGSEFGEVVWEEIVSAPVWLPPHTTPPRDLLKRREKRKPGESKWQPNYHETGPSYASAYGLVAAYHRPFARKADGTVRVTGDEGIRSHGSVDYMSIMRRHSHGCHRLHNHIAVRLFSFVVNHRPHKRTGHAPASFFMNLEYDNEKHFISIKQGGYVFKLDKPIFVMVEEGRIRGSLDRPVTTAIPKYNEECKGYYMPDGTAVVPKPNGAVIAVTNAAPCLPILEAAKAAAQVAAAKAALAGDAGVAAPSAAIPVVVPVPNSAPVPSSELVPNSELAPTAIAPGVAPGSVPAAAP